MSLHLILSLCLTAGAEAPADSASAQATSLVLIVANNRSAQMDRPPLQYADDDGAKYYQVFAAMAGAENTVLLTQFDRDTGRLFPSLVGVARPPTRAQIRYSLVDPAGMISGHSSIFLRFVRWC